MGIELQANSERENQAWYDNSPFTANHVSHREREKRAKESSSRENGYLSSKSKQSDVSVKSLRRSAPKEKGAGITNHKTFLVSWEVKVVNPKIGR